MAAIAVLVGDGMTDLTLEVTDVLLMLRVTRNIRQDILVAVYALNRYRIIIPVTSNLS
jgi:hypothetical protein